MLVVTRKDKEGIYLLDVHGAFVARVVLTKSTQGKAQIGIEAGGDVRILRDELVGTDALSNRSSSDDKVN